MPVQSGNRIVFLGSGGARIVVARQIRASGGIWMSLAGTELLVDPGPGALVRMTGSRHRLDPTKLAGILVSHRHLDHSGDINNMVEAMTMGGTEPRGVLLAPEDVIGGDNPVLLRYLRPVLEKIIPLKEGGEYAVGTVSVCAPVRHRHRGEVYGFRLTIPYLAISYVADTAFFPELAEHYRADIIIVNVVRLKPSGLDHLHLPEAEELLRTAKPKLAILSHFGMTMLRAKPWELARQATERTGVKVVAASDGKCIDLGPYEDRK
ncbi:MAG: MBL fold metallo-hydrolase [candidate division WOR-3 bacterium]|nr:MAG: MBL fold metallo-hydrolase [candidate division WOR-3 bacterium]